MQPTRRVIFYTSSMLVPEAVTQFDSISINDSTICICLCNQHNSAFLSSIRQRMILTMFPNPESINNNFFRARFENRKHLQCFLPYNFVWQVRFILKWLFFGLQNCCTLPLIWHFCLKKNKFILSETSKKFVVFEGIEYHSVRKTCVF